MPEPKVPNSDWREMASMTAVLTDESLKLSKDMKAARKEEIDYQDKKTIFFRLPAAEGARVPGNPKPMWLALRGKHLGSFEQNLADA